LQAEQLLPKRFSSDAVAACHSLHNSQDETGCEIGTGHSTMPASAKREGWAMKTFATLAATALVMAGTLGAPQAQARGGGAVAAGVIGGLAAGALLGAAISDAHAAPAYGYGYGYGRPVPAYGYAPVAHDYEVEEVPVYRRERIVRTYDAGPDYGYRNAGYDGRRHCDRRFGYGDRDW
jgi:hypothetical protein